VAVSLGNINPGNAQAITVLEEILKETEDRHSRMWAAYSLGNTDLGKAQAISALEEILKETQDTYPLILMQAAFILKEIDPANVRAIAVLKETKHGTTGWQVAESSGTRDPENPQEIPTLVKLLKETNDYSIRLQAVWTLGKIGQGNAEAINLLVQLLHQIEDDTTCWQIVESLGAILTTHKQRQEIIFALQPHLSNETYENNYKPLKNCYQLLWNIAQDLPYPNFYRAWHHLHTAPHPEVADQTPVGKTALTDTLNAQLLDLPNQLHPTPHTTPVCVDIEHLTQITDEDKLAKALSNRIFKQLFPGQTLPKISDCCDLETELINAQPRPHIALILHNGDPQESLLHLCQFLAPTVSIACITHTPLDAPLRGFPPDQENLVSALQSWLEQFNEQ
jgi:hypothetical protein